MTPPFTSDATATAVSYDESFSQHNQVPRICCLSTYPAPTVRRGVVSAAEPESGLPVVSRARPDKPQLGPRRETRPFAGPALPRLVVRRLTCQNRSASGGRDRLSERTFGHLGNE